MIQGSDEVEDDEEVEEVEPLMVGMVGVLEGERGRIIITTVIFIIIPATWCSGCILPAGGPGELDGHRLVHVANSETYLMVTCSSSLATRATTVRTRRAARA